MIEKIEKAKIVINIEKLKNSFETLNKVITLILLSK